MWGIVTLSALLYLQEPQLAHQKEPPVTKVTMGHEGGVEMGQPCQKSATQKEAFGGYDYEFVELPPSAFQTECPICHLILREPYLVSCCGTSFCHTCIQRLQADNSPCPNCREDNITVFPNKGLNRSLKQLQVYCTQRKDGCQWRGELGELDQHMNIRKECPLTVGDIKMTNFEGTKRTDEVWYSPPFYTHPQGYKMCLRVHANGSGDGEGTHVSVFAHLMRGEFDDHLKWPFRGHVVIQLCNQLQDKYHRGHTIDFSKTTDADIISRVTSGERAEGRWGCHTLIPHNDLNFNPTNNCQYLKNDCLHFQIVAVESLSEPGVLPTERTMKNFDDYKTDGGHCWHSKPFYTHPQGYKMGVRVDANGWGSGKDTHVSVGVFLMQGQFDDDLKWPLQGQVTVAMLNQLEDNNHTTYTIRFTDKTESEYSCRVKEGETAMGQSYPTFIAHTELNYNPTKNCQYLKYDCLRFRIVKVELK